MNCIVGIADGENVWMGADSLARFWDGQSSQFRSSKEPRVFKIGGVIVGVSTPLHRLVRKLKFDLELLDIEHGQDEYEYLVKYFLPQWKEVKRIDYKERKGEVLVGINGRIFHIHDDLSVFEPSGGIGACGSGAGAALGSLYSTKGDPSQKRLEVALEAAKEFSTGVKPPYVFVSSED